jgi:hypothetical protein
VQSAIERLNHLEQEVSALVESRSCAEG